ncbi:hypothetical protein OCOJLMKI_3964 [Methylobacterium iners]|uniref:Uncharacterized protein n=1 Tax=Methylobacterium iners TaxID=418707 RepID=A0ABQ4S2P1_9HYPH|nr:hypothetical protein OCOJLMKI_3964 [Methylobacterium iners]
MSVHEGTEAGPIILNADVSRHPIPRIDQAAEAASGFALHSPLIVS